MSGTPIKDLAVEMQATVIFFDDIAANGGKNVGSAFVTADAAMITSATVGRLLAKITPIAVAEKEE